MTKQQAPEKHQVPSAKGANGKAARSASGATPERAERFMAAIEAAALMNLCGMWMALKEFSEARVRRLVNG